MSDSSLNIQTLWRGRRFGVTEPCSVGGGGDSSSCRLTIIPSSPARSIPACPPFRTPLFLQSTIQVFCPDISMSSSCFARG